MSTSAAFAAILTANVFGMHFAVVTPQQRRKLRARLSPGPGAPRVPFA
jgi:hypothetical protein